MWDYDKLFAVGNVICVGDIVSSVDEFNIMDWRDSYANKELTHKALSNGKIQYIIRLDEHGNVVEKLFDRDRDMDKPMPELETGMFVRVPISGIGLVDSEHNHIIYQTGGYDLIDDEEYAPGVALKIVEVYSGDACGFDYCNEDVLIWRSPEYQTYLDSKN